MLTDWTLPHDLARTGLEAAAALVASYIEPGSLAETLVVMGCGYVFMFGFGSAIQLCWPEEARVLDAAMNFQREKERMAAEPTLCEADLRRAA